MEIVILDGYVLNPGDCSWQPIQETGHVTCYNRTDSSDFEKIIERIGNAEIVITNKTPITRQVMDACSNIRFIAVLATGYDIVDIEYAKEKNIPVSNVPVYGIYSVSQFTIGLLLELCLHIGHHSQTVHEGQWGKCTDWAYWDYTLIELKDKTMGLIGCGNIGKNTAKIAGALGMRVITFDKFPTEEGKKVAEYVDLDTLWSESDVIVLQMPLLPANIGIINKDTIKKMIILS